MKITIILLCIIILIVIIMIILFANKAIKHNKNFDLENNELELITKDIDLSCLELKPVDFDIKEEMMVEIKDSNLISKIDNIIPNSSMAIANTSVGRGLQKMATNLLESDIPIKDLCKSATNPESVRAIVRDSRHIVKNANLTPVTDKINNLSKVANVNAVMNVGSMIVGQYYMTEISNKLNSVQNGIDKISNFQDNDYKGRVLQVITDTLDTSEFQCEIIECEDVRKVKLNSLEIDKKECKRLIGHANESIKTLLKINSKDYQSYINNMKEIEKWYKYQQMMLQVLEQMALLDYTLNVRKVSKEQAYRGFYKYYNMSKEINKQIKIWHEYQQDKLHIKLDENMRKKEGFSGFISSLALWDENRGYKKMEDTTVKLIDMQMNDYGGFVEDKRDLYNENIKLIKKGDKYYYIPMSNN